MTLDFDHHSPEYAADPYRSLAHLCDSAGAFAQSTEYGGFWIAANWETAVRIAADVDVFTEGAVGDGTRAGSIPHEAMTVAYPPLDLEPPEFIPYRRLLAPHCSPRAADAMEPGIRYWVDWFIDRVAESGMLDLPEDFATPLPASVTADWLGLPPEDWRFYWSALHNPDHDGKARDMKDLSGRLAGEIDQRRGTDPTDLLSVIANATIDSELIGVDRVIGMTLLLLAGGTQTTGDLFSHALLHLDQHRDVHARLIGDDCFMRTATEEYLRMATPVLATGRISKCPAVVAGETLDAGASVLIGWAGANRDETVFEDPFATRLDRWPNRHLAFGVGPHRCVGSNIARVMFRVMVRRLLERLPDFRVVRVEPSPDRASFASFSRFEIEFTPTTRLLPEPVPPPQFRSIYDAEAP